jgi:hypothetical protein
LVIRPQYTQYEDIVERAWIIRAVISMRNGAGRGTSNNGNNVCLIDEKLIQNFKHYLLQQKQSPHTTGTRSNTSRDFHILEQENGRDLLSVSPETRQHAMKPLASLLNSLASFDAGTIFSIRPILTNSNSDDICKSVALNIK